MKLEHRAAAYFNVATPNADIVWKTRRIFILGEMFSRKPDEDNAYSKVMRTVVTTRLGGTTSMCPAKTVTAKTPALITAMNALPDLLATYVFLQTWFADRRRVGQVRRH